MKSPKKPPLKSKTAAKKKAVTLDDLQAQLNAINQKLDYLLVRAAPLNREEWHPLVEQASKCIDL